MTQSDTQPAPSATETPNPAESTGKPSAAPAAAPFANVEAEIRKRLEHSIAGKEVTVRFKDTKLVFKKWGLRKNLQMGAKVVRLVTTVKRHFPTVAMDSMTTPSEETLSLFTQIMSMLADDIMEIVAGSIHSPFPTLDAAEKWLDENVDGLDDLFDLAYIVWDQNLRGDNLGKLTSGVEGLTKKLASLSTSSSKN